jgi:hypothetical protein
MIHVWHMQGHTFYIMRGIKPRDLHFGSTVACSVVPRKNKIGPSNDRTWIKLVSAMSYSTCLIYVGRTGGVFFWMFTSSNNVSRFIRSLAGKNSASSDQAMIEFKSSSCRNIINLRAILTNDHVPSFLFFNILSTDILCLYFSANESKISTRAGGHPVNRSMLDSSLRSMGWLGMGKNMLACSSESQSLRGCNLEAVLITQKVGQWRVLR